MSLRLIAAVLVLGASVAPAQDSVDTELKTAIDTTIKGGFSYLITPRADIPNFNSAKDELAGAQVKGEYSDGVYHARTAYFEIYRKGSKIAVRTQNGWLPYEQFIAPMKQAMAEAFDDGDGRYWRKGNVTKGKKALSEFIQLQHLIHRADVSRLTTLGEAFMEMKNVGKTTVDGKLTVQFEGEFRETTATTILQGPFDELIGRGNLSFQNVSGVCRIWIQDGKVRRIHGRIGGKYGFYNEDDNVHRKGICVLDVHAELTKFGETKVEPPKEAQMILN
jgi:hypothetical protein